MVFTKMFLEFGKLLPVPKTRGKGAYRSAEEQHIREAFKRHGVNPDDLSTEIVRDDGSTEIVMVCRDCEEYAVRQITHRITKCTECGKYHDGPGYEGVMSFSFDGRNLE